MIQRIEFEDRGQDFLWWDIDDVTGVVVGCGPFQAWLWASGKLRIDLDTMNEGDRPVVLGMAHAPGGADLNYRITRIEIASGARPRETFS